MNRLPERRRFVVWHCIRDGQCLIVPPVPAESVTEQVKRLNRDAAPGDVYIPLREGETPGPVTA